MDRYRNHFRESAINLNLVNGNAKTGLNMRHFEITAAGGFMRCYHQPELENHFEVDKECVVFRSANELVEKIRYFLSHPEERAAIARAGQIRPLSNYLYSHRLKTLMDGVTLGPDVCELAGNDCHDNNLPDDCEALLDFDGDGFLDDCDGCLDSDSAELIEFQECPTGVSNTVLDDGGTTNDVLTQCSVGARSHGELTACVVRHANEWRRQGLLSGKDVARITHCAGTSNEPRPPKRVKDVRSHGSR